MPVSKQTVAVAQLNEENAGLAGLEKHWDKTSALKHGTMQELLTGCSRPV